MAMTILDVIVPAKPDMIRLPKTEDVSEVEIVAKKIEEVEKLMAGRKVQSILSSYRIRSWLVQCS